MWGVSTIAFVTGFSLDDGQGAWVLHFTPLAWCSHCSLLQGVMVPLLSVLQLGFSLTFAWVWAPTVGSKSQHQSGGVAGKAIIWKGQRRGGKRSPSPRLVLFEHCLAHFFYFSKHEVSLSFYSLSCLLSTTSNQMGSRDKTIKTQCLCLAGCQVCMPSKYLRQKNLNRQYFF